MPTISKRKLESYKRAETVCRELRFHISNNSFNSSEKSLFDLLIKWMNKTGNIKYRKP